MRDFNYEDLLWIALIGGGVGGANKKDTTTIKHDLFGNTSIFSHGGKDFSITVYRIYTKSSLNNKVYLTLCNEPQ